MLNHITYQVQDNRMLKSTAMARLHRPDKIPHSTSTIQVRLRQEAGPHIAANARVTPMFLRRRKRRYPNREDLGLCEPFFRQTSNSSVN
ncbi:uncharacterized protein N7482_002184 [Penicillium canariense]|uniref:Uncharacterized protein n=1 Tax=Penicillium canariense TaxID=189055 RepID=A0A9W9IH64_9EURO|nr:uncharacterized protein N7482_002184 [Penicillium canariense]KAJ5176307.1 hypothetical protein N7482_002184 [Penicillium canariense]